MTQPERIADLSTYLSKLIRDVAAQGKVVKIQGDPVQVAAVAILSGSIAMIEAMASDVKVLAGRAHVQGKALARPMAQMIAARAVEGVFEKLFGK